MTIMAPEKPAASVATTLPVDGQGATIRPEEGRANVSPLVETARFGIGQLVRHRQFPFRGVIFDVDPEFANSEEWWEAIPDQLRPKRDQPFYHLFAENDEASYIAYVSQQNLEEDEDTSPVGHPAVSQVFGGFENGRYMLRPLIRN